MEFLHNPVLLKECIDGLAIKPDGIYVDGTVGGAGHSLEIAKLLKEKGRLIGIDRDCEALSASEKRLKGICFNYSLVNDNYKNIDKILQKMNICGVDGILLDLGISSYQIDNPSRGFSYMADGPLDMRMNTNDEITAKYVVNEFTKEKLIKVFKEYGEERYASKIADCIIECRSKKEIDTTLELAGIVKLAVGNLKGKNAGHPAKKVFQAIRICVNSEILDLEIALKGAIDSLKVGGRLCVITFHSLEDRIVKNTFIEESKSCICPPDFPTCVCNKKARVRLITKKPIIPNDEEYETNSRAHSAKLRVVEKLN